MEDLQQLKDKLTQLKTIPHPELKIIIAMHNLQLMIDERERKMKKP